MIFTSSMTSRSPHLNFATFTFLLLYLSPLANAGFCNLRNCKEWLDNGYTKSGVYTIYLYPHQNPGVMVYCDMTTDGGGWTVFQRRLDGSVDFYQNWVSYVRGFGNPYGEYWLGLNNIHNLTSLSPQELRVDMSDFQSTSTYAKYSQFAVDPEPGYILHVSGFTGHSVAGDCLSIHDGMRFSTRDNDQDTISKYHCAVRFRGAWWHANCYCTNPNGLYRRASYKGRANGVNWRHFKGLYYSLKSIEFKMRPIV